MKIFPAKLESLHDMLDFVASFCDDLKIRLAVEEALVNIIRHSQTEGMIHIACESSQDAFSILIMDRGIPFDPTQVFEEGEGKGILLMKKLMDRIDYQRKNGENILRMIRRQEPFS